MPLQVIAAISGLITLSTVAGGHAPQNQGHPQLQRLMVSKSSNGSITSKQSGRSWHLANFNKTTYIDAAYRFDQRVIIFGWIGSNIGITTIINADTDSEELEFLCFYPHITPAGLIVFERWYPHFSDPSIVSDAIAKLDLRTSIPQNVPSKPNENPTDKIGTTIYPMAAISSLRHDIRNNFAITDNGSLLFIADHLSSGKLCLVRLSLSEARTASPKENCVTPDAFGIGDLSEMRIRQFSENAFGDLVLSTDLGVPTSATHREFEVNKDTLSISLTTNVEETGQKAFPIPWSIQRNALTSFVPLDVAAKGISAHAQDTVKARLLIDKDGDVNNVAISGLPDALGAAIRVVILQWRFKPTLLDGRQVEVATEFTTQVGAMNKTPE